MWEIFEKIEIIGNTQIKPIALAPEQSGGGITQQASVSSEADRWRFKSQLHSLLIMWLNFTETHFPRLY